MRAEDSQVFVWGYAKSYSFDISHKINDLFLKYWGDKKQQYPFSQYVDKKKSYFVFVFYLFYS